MMKRRAAGMFMVAFLVMTHPSHGVAAATDDAATHDAVTHVIQPLMAQYGVPGIAVGVISDGQMRVYNYGVASKATGARVAPDTLFEIGSVTKTFTATLVSYAQSHGALSLTAPVSQYLPMLRGSAFDRITSRDLGTYSAGGLPLQFPDAVQSDAQRDTYYRDWRPIAPPGTLRIYSNTSIGLLGWVAASSLHEDFAASLKQHVIAPLGLTNTYLSVPAGVMPRYAQGYTQADRPIRMRPGVLGAETYGITTTAGDLLRFLSAHMGLIPLDVTMQGVLTATHTGYGRVGIMTQDLVWEQYRAPVTLADLLAGNAKHVLRDPNAITRLDPPEAPHDDVLLDKTGSTNGFGSYVAFMPARRVGIVLLANRNYPIPARVTAAYAILSRLAGSGLGE